MAIKQRGGVRVDLWGKVRQDDRVDVEVHIEWRGLDLFFTFGSAGGRWG